MFLFDYLDTHSKLYNIICILVKYVFHIQIRISAHKYSWMRVCSITKSGPRPAQY